MIIISIDIKYFIDYTRTNDLSIDIQKLVENYSDNYKKAVSSFDILIASERADIIYKNDIAYKCIADYGKTNKVTEQSKFLSREIKTKHSDGFNVGDIVEFENKVSKELETCLFICKKETSDGYDISTIQKCNNTLKFYNKNNILCKVPCIISKGNISEESNRFQVLASDEYMLCIPYTSDTSAIIKDIRFIISGEAYKTIGTDKISQNGLLWVRIKEDEIIPDDKPDEDIANYYSHQVLREIIILNGSSSTLLYTNSTLQLNVECKENGVIVNNPLITYESDNEYVCTVNENGLVTAQGTGDAIVTVRFGDVNDTILIHADMTVVNNYVIMISPTDIFVNSGKSKTFTATVMNNGVEDTTKQVTWSISNKDGTSNVYATITANGNSCIVSASNQYNATNKIIILKSTLSFDGTKFKEQELTIKSLV